MNAITGIFTNESILADTLSNEETVSDETFFHNGGSQESKNVFVMPNDTLWRTIDGERAVDSA